ncbi:uncharacterized protein FIESC28_03397 [Fusarium coffeatum]|uniref:Cyanovirin-N domain-containing protein n=1 Tax=Fusarium coffeatum TaxID=231269 RepID=A0A366S397_9HYPO|nr:uncharacterized protein FIESC28_03397 [Fusarium coffeatum]RBR23781.1 hypothetical protein FIESC28_03397 [Fusarium coffeatum]
MSFSASAESYHLHDGHILKAVVRNREGEPCESEIDLDQFIGNQDGWFMWDGADWSHSAQDARLEGTTLTAELPKRDGGYRERQGINLDDRITNNDGVLVFN